MPQRLTRRRFLAVVGGSLVAAGSTAGYSYRIEPDDLQLERIQIDPPLPAGLRIGALSDLHVTDEQSLGRVERAVEMLTSARPDLIVLLGDYTTYARPKPALRRNIEAAAGALSRLSAPLGVFAILGNHDYHGERRHLRSSLKRAGIELLVNQGATFSLPQGGFNLVGLADALRMRPDYAAARRDLPPDLPLVALVHEPDFALRLGGASLVLGGHSHGGQVRLPLLGAPNLPRLARRFPWGLERAGDTLVYTSRGVGMIRPHVRFNCPPEVTLLEVAAPDQ